MTGYKWNVMLFQTASVVNSTLMVGITPTLDIADPRATQPHTNTTAGDSALLQFYIGTISIFLSTLYFKIYLWLYF